MSFALNNGDSPEPMDFAGVNPNDFTITDGIVVITVTGFTLIDGTVVSFTTSGGFPLSTDMVLNYTATGARPKAGNGLELQDFTNLPVIVS
jgi:hypothetical protein